MKFDKHGECLISAVAELFSNPKRCCDLEVTVGTTVFTCHKLVLSLKSSYFEQMLYSESHQTAIHQITLDDIRPENFKNILHYIYKGEIELNPDVLSEIIRMAKLFDICDLKQVCLQFARDTLDIDNCITYWKLAEEFGDHHLGRKCFELSSREIVTGAKSIGLRDITEVMLKMAIEQDDLSVSCETDVCAVILRWCDEDKNREEPVHRYELLQCIRWSGVDFEYVKLHVVNNDVLSKDRECAEYLSKVILYKLCGIQFDGLLTFHRPSSGFEMCAIVLGLDTTKGLKKDCFRVSLQRKQTVDHITTLPTYFQCESTACSNSAAMYITGVGSSCKETWRWDSVGGWARCGDMVEGRRRHCATFVNNTSMYALGGFVDSTETTLSSIEQYHTIKNKWFTVGKLVHSTESTGCVAYKTSIYLFGGSNQGGVDLDYIQVYDTTTMQCSVLVQRLPKPVCLLRAVLWNKSAILMNDTTCLIFHLDQQTIQSRDQFAVRVIHFGLVIENEMLFVIGGDTSSNETWTYAGDVKCVPVGHIINGKAVVEWTRHAELTAPSAVYAFSTITLPLK